MKSALTVTQLNEYIGNLISSDDFLDSLEVEGEISNCTIHYTGHVYFSIKDESASIRCVMFSSYASKLDFKPEDGLKVRVYGYLSFYQKSGQTQISVTFMRKGGKGDLFEKFEALKKKLDKEGLFDESRKKKIPFLPEKIGLITSSTGAVLHDIQNTLESRFNNYGLILYPATVQGANAHKTVIKGIEYINEKTDADVIIIARGGGSVEDLWAFNEEELAYAVVKSKIPIISAIGHETDFTILDFVADLRAATPTQAAQLVMPEKSALKLDLINRQNSLNNTLNKLIRAYEERLDNLQKRPVLRRPEDFLNVLTFNLDKLSQRMIRAGRVYFETMERKGHLLKQKLEMLNPLKVLARGYTITMDEQGHLVKSVNEINRDDIIETRFVDGSIVSKVKEVK